MLPPSSSVLRNKACMIIAVGGGKKHDSSYLCSTTNYSFAWHADVEMSHHQSVLKTQTWLKICLFLGPFLLFRMEIGELFDISPVASLLQFRLCPSDTINNWAFVYPAHLNITVNKHFSCDVEICCPSCLIPAPLIEDTISTVIMALSVWSGQVSVLVCVPTEVCVCCGVYYQSGHACLQLLPSVETLKSTAMERCHGWDIHARPHILQRPWSGLDLPHMHVPSIGWEAEQMPKRELLLQSEQAVQEFWVQ